MRVRNALLYAAIQLARLFLQSYSPTASTRENICPVHRLSIYILTKDLTRYVMDLLAVYETYLGCLT
jgi:hypothetical protein